MFGAAMTLALIRHPERAVVSTPEMENRLYQLDSVCESVKDTSVQGLLENLGRCVVSSMEPPKVMTEKERELYDSIPKTENRVDERLFEGIVHLLAEKRYNLILDFLRGD